MAIKKNYLQMSTKPFGSNRDKLKTNLAIKLQTNPAAFFTFHKARSLDAIKKKSLFNSSQVVCLLF